MDNSRNTLTENIRLRILELAKSLDEQEALPPELKLAEDWGVSRNTVRDAIRRLVHEGVFYRVQGKGTFKADLKIPFPMSRKMKYSPTVIDQGFQPSSKIIKIECISSGYYPEVQDKLKLYDASPLWRIQFLRYIDTIPLIFSVSYTPCSPFTNLDSVLTDNSCLYDIFESHYGITSHQKESYELETALPDEASMRHLRITRNIPVFILTSRTLDASKQPIDFRISKSRSDFIKFRI